MMTDHELYDLCKASKVTLNADKNLVVHCPIPADMVEALKHNKAEIVEALSGYCFARDVYSGAGLRNWKIVKASVIADVYYPPITVFSGTAMEVDTWARAHRDDPFFSDKYTSKYIFVADHDNN